MSKPNFDRTIRLSVGDEVEKTTGDYYFKGLVIVAFRKAAKTQAGMILGGGPARYIVQNEDGVVHVMSDQQLRVTKKASER